MRAILTSLVLTTTLSAVPALAEDVQPAFPSRVTVYLDGPADLARLREVNPDHYARAQRVLAAANQLCRPGAAQVLAIAGAQDLGCAANLLRTSNPPKRQITFRLDDIRYVALVTITADPPRLTGIR